jgi:hypothetical protein
VYFLDNSSFYCIAQVILLVMLPVCPEVASCSGVSIALNEEAL